MFRLCESERSSGWSEVFTETRLRGILKGKNYQALGNMQPFVESINNHHADEKKTALPMMVHTCYSEILAVVTRDMRQ